MAGAGDTHNRKLWVLVAMTLANAMILVDQTAIPLALPDIIQTFHVSTNAAQWVINASLLPLAGLLVLGGRLGDVLGRRKVFLTGAVMFGGASAVGGLAPAYAILIAARVVQGTGGALMLPATVAILSAAYKPSERGKALGTMGGTAAVAGALGPTIGGVLTSVFSWRAVLLVCVPLLLTTVYLTLRFVPEEAAVGTFADVDVAGAVLLCIALVALVFGLSQTQSWGVGSLKVWALVGLAVLAFALFVIRERTASNPLMDFGLLRRHPNYLGASISQGLAGMAEMGLGVLLPLVLILNLGMAPAKAGLALIPTTVPMVLVAPLVGRWYDRAGGRPPLIVGFATLALSGLLLAIGVNQNGYLPLLPGLVVFGIGLAIVLTVNDPVTLDTIDAGNHGQASGVSATAEQGGGAIGIALLYAVFHYTYIDRLTDRIHQDPSLAELTAASSHALKSAIIAAEATGLDPASFPSALRQYLKVARDASDWGNTVAFLLVAAFGIVGLVTSAVLVRKAGAQPEGVPGVTMRADRDHRRQVPAPDNT